MKEGQAWGKNYCATVILLSHSVDILALQQGLRQVRQKVDVDYASEMAARQHLYFIVLGTFHSLLPTSA